ncbi:MAG TPA: uroporphyrinogen-III C-methyltransferase, partial [Pyrinomonadaceae bacterium]|nr:uroporphyrinogen-III C-methyltransferase [Pyrinomonadaceae bacterium]
DIPVKVDEAAGRHSGVNYRITEPLSAHPFVIEASVERLRETIDHDTDDIASHTADYRARPGRVYLVGAGPGDPGLLTIKARDLLASCDVVIYDYLVNPELLGHVPLPAERIYVGKVGGGRQTPQDHINYLLIRHAQTGARVVRLKGGDPFLFGRGGEEAEALRDAGIRFEVVPGISSALAVPAYAGIPLTHRDFSSSVSVVTGARARNAAACTSATHSADTLVILMGVTHLPEIVADLIAAGRPIETPAAVIRWGTYEGQLTVTGTLETIATDALNAGLRPPAVIVVGEVVKLRERLKWFERTFEANSDTESQAVLTFG